MPVMDKIYEKFGIVESEPDPFIVANMPALKRYGIRNVLDAGCGTGRHTHLLLENGFSAINSFDISKNAIRLLRDSLSKEELKKVSVSLADIEHFNSEVKFDAALLIRVLSHLKTMGKIQNSIKNIAGLLREGGFLIISEISTQHSRYGKGREISPGFFAFADYTEMDDWDQPHHFFSETEMRRLLNGFQIIAIQHAVSQFGPASEKDATISVIARKSASLRSKGTQSS